MSLVERARAVPSPAWDRPVRFERRSEKFATESVQVNFIRNLPDTALSLIISNLHIKEQVGVAELVSKTWRRASRLLPQDTLDFQKASKEEQIQISVEVVSRLVARAIFISNSHQPRLGSIINPVTAICLTRCCPKAGETAAQLITYCIQLCPNLQQLLACQPGDGRSDPTLPLSADGALQVLRACNKHSKIKQVRVDVDAYSLADTWETTSYQRAIGVEPLWQTFLLLLEDGCHIQINRLKLAGYKKSGHSRSSVAPSEFRKVTNSRVKDLAAALSKNTSLCGLHIPGSYLAPAAIEALCTSFKDNPQLKALELSGRPLYGNLTDEQLSRGL